MRIALLDRFSSAFFWIALALSASPPVLAGDCYETTMQVINQTSAPMPVKQVSVSRDEVIKYSAFFSFETETNDFLLKGSNKKAVNFDQKQVVELIAISKITGKDPQLIKADLQVAFESFKNTQDAVKFITFEVKEGREVSDDLKWVDFLTNDFKIKNSDPFGLANNDSIAAPKYDELLATLRMVHAVGYTREQLSSEAESIGEMFAIGSFQDFLGIETMHNIHNFDFQKISAILNSLQSELVFYKKPFGLSRSETTRSLELSEAISLGKLFGVNEITVDGIKADLNEMQKSNRYIKFDEFFSAITTTEKPN